MISEVTGERDRRLARNAIHVGRAKVLLDEIRYQEAVQELQQIPPPLRDETVTDLLTRAESVCQEIADLKQQIRRPDGVPFAQRMLQIERLLELQPGDAQVRRWATQIHDHLLETSRRKLKQRQYRESLDLLHKLPLCAQSESSQKLLRQVTELEYLDSELRLAPTVTSVTMDAAKRLIRIDEGHPTARQALQEMMRRCRAGKQERGNSKRRMGIVS